ncbi:MAG: monooxygenase [Parcubacteria group bacterium Gr01-1014_8]|nr:MAG: monooxygenase [Parcubacteria group bacterium Gr01-1014_8]
MNFWADALEKWNDTIALCVSDRTMKYLLAVVIFATAGGLFFWQMNVAQMPDTATVQENAQAGNPFGDDSTEVGSLDDDTNREVEVEDEDGGTTSAGTGTATVPAGGASTGSVIRATLKLHNKQDDCWVAYKSVVYDITRWLPRHPGSAGAIVPYCGTAEEFTAAFTKQHGTSKEGRLKQEAVVEGALSN